MLASRPPSACSATAEEGRELHELERSNVPSTREEKAQHLRCAVVPAMLALSLLLFASHQQRCCCCVFVETRLLVWQGHRKAGRIVPWLQMF